MTDSEREWYEERSAIYEFDALLPKEQAEKLAFSDLEFKRNLERAGDDKPASND